MPLSKPRVIREQLNEALADHSGRAEDADFLSRFHVGKAKGLAHLAGVPLAFLGCLSAGCVDICPVAARRRKPSS